MTRFKKIVCCTDFDISFDCKYPSYCSFIISNCFFFLNNKFVVLAIPLYSQFLAQTSQTITQNLIHIHFISVQNETHLSENKFVCTFTYY